MAEETVECGIGARLKRLACGTLDEPVYSTSDGCAEADARGTVSGQLRDGRRAGPTIIFTGAAIAVVSAATVATSMTPGTKMPSAPASRYACARASVPTKRSALSPASLRYVSTRALMNNGMPAPSAALRADMMRFACSATSRNGDGRPGTRRGRCRVISRAFIPGFG
jgi:hypothetical protein